MDLTVITLENPPGFVVRTEAQKAAWDNWHRLERGIEGGWLRYGSTTAIVFSARRLRSNPLSPDKASGKS